MDLLNITMKKIYLYIIHQSKWMDKTLTEGALVQYELHRTDKGLQARKVLQVCCD